MRNHSLHGLLLSLVLAGLVLLGAGVAGAEDDYPINVYPCPRAATPPALDGVLDDAVWQQAPVVSGFTMYGKPVLAEVQTSFRVLYDDRALYFAIACDEPLLDRLLPLVFARDEHPIFSHETIELFLDPDHTHDLYYQLAMNASGSLYDGRREDITYNSATVVKSGRTQGGWTLELAVPWESLGTRPAVSKVIGFNVCRDRNLGDKEWTNWARTVSGFHDPVRFAHLVLGATPEQLGRLSEELRKGDRRGPLTVFSSEGFSESTYAQLAAAGLADLQRLLGELEQERDREPDAGAKAELTRRLQECRTRAGELQRGAAGKLDAATWTRLDVELHKQARQMRQMVWEARLSALLGSL